MAIWIFAAMCAYFVKGLCGFANTLVFSSILSFGNNNVKITPVDLLIGYPANILMAFKERKSLQLELCLPVIVFLLLGSIPASFVLKIIDPSIIKLIFGFVIIIIGTNMLLGELKGRHSKTSRIAMILIGILSGVLCGLYGIGALLGVYFTRISKNTHAFKANISFVFSIENTIRIITYCIWGILTKDILKTSIILIPFMLVAFFLGMMVSKHVKEKSMKLLVIVLLICSGTILVFQSLIF